VTRAFGGVGRAPSIGRTGGDRSATTLASTLNLLNPGEEVISRDDVVSGQAVDTGTVFFSYFTARRSEAITKVQVNTGGTAGVTLTLARVGVYTAIGGTLTLVASTTNDTTMWTAANTAYQKALSATWNKLGGQRYAVAVLVIGTTMPTLEALAVRPLTVALPPRIQGELVSQADLPASTPESGLAAGTRRFQAIFLP
jgi:hypothetical protein